MLLWNLAYELDLDRTKVFFIRIKVGTKRTGKFLQGM